MRIVANPTIKRHLTKGVKYALIFDHNRTAVQIGCRVSWFYHQCKLDDLLSKAQRVKAIRLPDKQGLTD